MPPTNDVTSPGRARLRNSHLWIVAAALGAMTLYSMVAVIHDDRQSRQAAHVVVAATAEQVTSRAAHRLELRALEAFAPVSSLAESPRPSGAPRT